MRLCSAGNIAPIEVDEAIIDRFMSYRSETGSSADDAFRRLPARAWNGNVQTVQGWPTRRLVEPPVKAAVEVPWGQFPEGLRRDVDQYIPATDPRASKPHGTAHPTLRPSTIRTRRAELAAAAQTAVSIGVPIETLNSLSALLAPEVAEKVLDAYWSRNGENPKPFTIELACRFIAIARETRCVDDAGCEHLDEMRRDLEEHRQSGLTGKNIALIRQVLTPGVWNRVDLELVEQVLVTPAEE